MTVSQVILKNLE